MPQRSQVVRWRGALEGLLPLDHLARFVWQVVAALDFSAVEAGYGSVQGGPGRPPYHPRLLAALWVYGMTQGMETAAAIAQACRLRDDFRWLAGGLCPSDQTLLLMMLATSEKRWEPSYNADLTVTRHGLIVSQFLTKAPTDYHHFSRALPAVLSTLGRPDAWVGDGHYGTQENVLLAHRAGVLLYAPPAGAGSADAPSPSAAAPGPSDQAAANTGRPRKFSGLDFRPDPERDVLICPAGEELRLIGIYAEAHRAGYRVYGRSGCGPCPGHLHRDRKIPDGWGSAGRLSRPLRPARACRTRGPRCEQGDLTEARGGGAASAA